MAAPALALAWALSALVLAAPRGMLPDPGSASRTALCLVPWLALGGLPRACARSSARDTLATALLLAPLALAMVLDVHALARTAAAGTSAAGTSAAGTSAAGTSAAGTSAAWASTLQTACIGLGLFLVLQLAARRAAAGSRPHLHGALWLMGVALLPVASAMAAWDGRPGGGPAWLAWAATVSPLEWAHNRLVVEGGSWAQVSSALAPAAWVLLLLGVAGTPGERAHDPAPDGAA